MKFFFLVQNEFIDMEFGQIIKQAKDYQLDYSISKIKEFSFLNDSIIDEILPEDTPEVILKKRHKIKNIKNARKRI